MLNKNNMLNKNMLNNKMTGTNTQEKHFKRSFPLEKSEEEVREIMGKYLKEVRWEKKTRLLLYEADEEPETDEHFSMQTNGALNDPERKRHRKEGKKR